MVKSAIFFDNEHVFKGSVREKWNPLYNFKQIIQILQPIVIDYLSPHLYIVDFS